MGGEYEHTSNQNVLFRLAALEKDNEKTKQDLYYGNGKPGLTTRVAMNEESVEKINKNLNRLVWLAVSTLLTVLVFVIEQNIKGAGPH